MGQFSPKYPQVIQLVLQHIVCIDLQSIGEFINQHQDDTVVLMTMECNAAWDFVLGYNPEANQVIVEECAVGS